MKKLTAILLSLVLALSLAVPALAAPADGAYTVDGEPVPTYTPGDPIPTPFLPEATDDAVLGIIGGADGPTAIVTTPVDWGVLLDQSYLDPDAAIQWFKEKHPERVAELRANAYDYFAQEYGEYWTVEEYMESFGMTEEDFLDDMVQIQVSRLVSAEAVQAAINTQKEAMGGVVGQLGVIVNGKYVQFPDAIPESNDGTTMVPVRALVEALGGEVEVKEDKVVCAFDGVSVTFEMNGAEVDVERQYPDDPPKTQFVTMAVVTYQKDGRTYVPVRFLAETLGYEVGWDPLYQTVVLMDRAALAAEIDQDFTILNKVQANKGIGMEEGRNYQADMKGAVSLTRFDTLNGGKTYKADLTAKQLFNTEAASAQLSLKLSGNVMDELIKHLISSNSPEEDVAAVREQMETVLDTLEDMEVILTREGLGWFRAAALDGLAGKDGVWLGFDLGGELGELAFASAGEATIGSVLAYMADKDSAPHYQSVLGMADLMAGLYSDDKFTTTGGISTLTIDLDTLLGLYDGLELSEEDIAEAKAAFKEYKIVMKVDAKGGAEMSVIMETAAQQGVPGMRIAMDITQAGGNLDMTMKYHIANLGEMELTLTSTQKAASDGPMTQPPEGATVVDAAVPFEF